MAPYLHLLTTPAHRRPLPARRRPAHRATTPGSSTLEMVIIGLGLFLVATAVVAIITNAIMSRANQIN